jgi:hypothetical protein
MKLFLASPVIPPESSGGTQIKIVTASMVSVFAD